MKNFVAGVKPGVGPVLKIMRDDSDNPFTTPNTNYGKFLFNSETTKVGYIDKILEFVPDFVTYPTGSGVRQYYFPSGTDFNTCQMMIECEVVGNPSFKLQRLVIFKEFFGRSFMPLVEFRSIPSSGQMVGPTVNAKSGQVHDVGYVLSFPSWSSSTHWAAAGSLYGPWRKPAYRLEMTNRSIEPRHIATVFNLPCDGTPLPDNSETPTSGQEVIRIDGASGMARIALPGRTIADTNADNFILHEDKIPAKVLKSGEITVAIDGTATITTPIPMTDTTYMDFHARKASTVFWQPPYISGNSANEALSFTYEVSGSTITIINTSDYEITIRYAVCSADKSGFTSGGSKILLRDNDGAQDYVQIKRPGSSDTSPSLNDIMIDTRLSYLPILDEGYLTYPDDFTTLTGGDRYKGNMVASVSFENPDGVLPFVKCGVVFAGDDSLELKLGNNTNPLHPITYWGSHKIGYGGSWDNRCEGTSTWAEIVSDTSVNFYASGTNPFFYSGGSTASFGSDVVGLRYYIFGIPSDL